MEKGPGLKFDSAKLRWDLLPIECIEDAVRIITFGAAKYDDDNWKNLEKGRDRYYAALMRHLVAYRTGEELDPESGETHLSHAITNLIFLMWLEKEIKKMNKFIKTIPSDKVGYEFLRSLNGLLDLTDRELELLSSFLVIDMTKRKKDDGIDTALTRKSVMKELSITKDNLSRYIKMFRKKQIFIKDYSNNTTHINRALIPVIIGNKVVQITMILKIKEDEI